MSNTINTIGMYLVLGLGVAVVLVWAMGLLG
jgi:hypothetical protein